MHPNLISDRSKIAERIEAKRQRLADWLLDEVFTDYKTASKVIGTTDSAAYKTLMAMVKDGLVKTHDVARSKMFTLTPHGQFVFMRDDEEAYTYDPRVSDTTVKHTLAVQQIRLAAEAAGWSNWTAERKMRRAAAVAKQNKQPFGVWKIPDALATNAAGLRIAVEFERTMKSTTRYREILAEYLHMRADNQIAEVHYICENDKFASRLQRIFESIETVSLHDGSVRRVEPKHLAIFKFFGPTWPSNVE
jgi:hypothetical protein